MGVLTMTISSDQLNQLIREYSVVRKCSSCAIGIMLPSISTITKEYKGEHLIIESFSVFRCENPQYNEVTYGTGSFIKVVRKAKSLYDETGKFVYDAQELLDK